MTFTRTLFVTSFLLSLGGGAGAHEATRAAARSRNLVRYAGRETA